MELRPYGATAAREHGKSGAETRPSRLTIDAHCHLHVQEAHDLIDGILNPMAILAVRYTNPRTTAQNVKQNQEDRIVHLTDLDQRLRDMDRQGIDLQVLIPVPFQAYYSVRNSVGHKAIQTINNKLSSIAQSRPDRFLALGHLPLQDGDAAAREMERGVKELGLKGFQVLGSVNGSELSDRSLDPMWEMAEKLDTLMVLHPNGYPQGDRFLNHYFNNIIGNPLDTTVAIHHLIFDGTLERYPKIIFSQSIDIVVSGNMPKPEKYLDYPEHINFDYQSLEPIDNPKIWNKISMISLSFKKISNWNGKGRLIDLDHQKIKSIIDKVHSYDKPLRFWATPDSKSAWKIFSDMGVDFINTDQPCKASNYLDSLNQQL